MGGENNERMSILCESVKAAGVAAYRWDIESDTLIWSGNAAEILEVDDEDLLKTGRAYARLLNPDNMTSRFEAVMGSTGRDEGEGVPYSVEYLINPRGPERNTRAWVEDVGRWFAGEDGQPRFACGIVRRIDERYENEQKLHFLGNRDPLTGLLNRACMSDALDEAILAAERSGSSCAFMIVSIDNLPVIADAYGHDISDEVILQVGKRLKGVKRMGDSLARFADAKFGIILNDCTAEDIGPAAQRFLFATGEEVIETSKGPVWALVSLGAVVLPEHAHDHEGAIVCAEEALSEAVAKPMSSAIIYKPEPNRISRRMLNARCAAEVVSALRNNSFTLAFQPIVDAQTGKPVMHESLLRMHDKTGNVIAAAHLIPIAEKLGLIRLMDLNVLDLVLETLRGNPQARLSMNISGVTAADPGWFRRIVDILGQNTDLTDRLVVEITETAMLNELSETGRLISRLREAGCRVAIDDFGAGYTSYRNLKELDADIVKLDGAFCDNLADNPDNQYFVRSLLDLARNMNLEVIAEWVQREEDAALLREWGVHYFQGHLFGAARIGHPWPSPRMASKEGFESAGQAAPSGAARGTASEPRPAFGQRKAPSPAAAAMAEIMDAADTAEQTPPLAPSATAEDGAASPVSGLLQQLEQEMQNLREYLATMRSEARQQPPAADTKGEEPRQAATA